jgi:ribosomal-protein-alanine N-acetyltransferase
MEAEARAARPADAAALARISGVSFPDPWPEAVFRTELRRPETRAWVAAEPRDKVIAYVLGWRVLGEVQVLSLAVDLPWRGRGVARDLLLAYLRELRAEGVRGVQLEVRASNGAAQALYRELGFARRGERARYYPGGESALLLGVEL